MNSSALPDALLDLIRLQPKAENAVAYLTQQANSYRNEPTKAAFYRVFTAIPRFVGKQPIVISPEKATELNTLRKGFTVEGWSLDRLARVWWLLQLSPDDQMSYFSTIEALFKAAEINELVALYSSLPLLANQSHWQFQATEAVRSNMGPVQDALMLHNPYPAEQLDEPAWNQLIMKAFFCDKPVLEIAGFEARANENLARIATDYAKERRAAGRSIPSELWLLVEPFVTETNRSELEDLFSIHGPTKGNSV